MTEVNFGKLATPAKGKIGQQWIYKGLQLYL